MTKRIQILFIFFIFLVLMILGKSLWIQTGQDHRLGVLAKKQFQSKILVRPARGSVFDRNGEALVVNLPAFSLAASPKVLSQKKKRPLARLISKWTSISSRVLEKRLEGDRDFLWLKRHLSTQELNELKKLNYQQSDGSFIEGLWLVKESNRVYPHESLAREILGSTNVDGEGISGLESYYNKTLKGESSSMNAIRDGIGRSAFIDLSETYLQSMEGESLHLTLDVPLQHAVEAELRNAMDEYKSVSGTIIVMNSETGEILALANEPTKNSAVVDGYEPGSVMKPAILLSALENGFKLTDKIHGEHGKIEIQGHTISEAESHEKFEWISLRDMIVRSSNVVSAKLGMKLGREKVYETLSKLGFGQKTGIDYPGEIAGWLGDYKKWKPIHLANISFGHGVLLTRMQVLQFYALLQNGGRLVTPRLVHRPGEAAESKRVVSEKIVKKVEESLLGATEDEEGTGKLAKLDGFRVAGKTGTAQKIDPLTKRYSRKNYVSTFVGYPVGVQPQVTILVSLDSPKPTYYASQTAAPVFSRVLRSVIHRYRIPVPTKEKPLEDQIHQSLSLAKTTSSSQILWKRIDQNQTLEVPKLKGKSIREVLSSIENKKVSVRVLGTGFVCSSVPSEQESIRENQVLTLYLSNRCRE